jgi:hypothetical protein
MSYINDGLSPADQAMGTVGNIKLAYNHPLNVPNNFSAVCDPTSQNLTSVSIQNLSSAFALTVYVDPAPASYPGGFIDIAANNPTPIRWAQNYNAAKLVISNISQESATAKITLTDLG